jgi:hypothetical protein
MNKKKLTRKQFFDSFKEGEMYHFKKLNLSLVLKFNKCEKWDHLWASYSFDIIMSNCSKISVSSKFLIKHKVYTTSTRLYIYNGYHHIIHEFYKDVYYPRYEIKDYTKHFKLI